jgi:hypothetical protein
MLIDMKAFARAGAIARLNELQHEMERIGRAFPGLRTATPGRAKPAGKVAARATAAPVGRRKPMSAAEKKAVSERMRRYWAGRRKSQPGPAAAAAAEGTAEANPAATAPSPKRTMSPEARERISAAQKKRWAATKRGGKKR